MEDSYYDIPLTDGWDDTPYVTIEEMQEILKDKMGPKYAASALKKDEESGLYYTTFIGHQTTDIVLEHLLVEQMMEMRDQVDWAKVTHGYDTDTVRHLEEIYQHPLVWMDEKTFELDKKYVVLGRVARPLSSEERTECSPDDMFFIHMLGSVRVLWFADNMPVGDEYGELEDMIRWSMIMEDTIRYSFYENEAPRFFNTREFRNNIEYIARERGGAKAAEIVRLLRQDWPDIVAMKLFEIDKLTPEQREDFRLALFEGMDRNMRKWEAEEQPSPTPNAKPSCFPLLTEECRKKNKVDATEAEIRAACHGTAVGLWKTLRTNASLGYVEPLEPWTAADLYHTISEYFGKLPYNERNFRDARNKRCRQLPLTNAK